MFEMFGRPQRADLIVLRDIDPALEALREALNDADPEERPGLRRALAILEEAAGAEDPRLRWTRQVLADAGIDPREKEGHAVKAVRQALPGLTLKQAVDLVKQAQEER
ncbi:hypothetical protein [Nocardiopsis composta]|uniref:Uncharacterized protein n=1 Tax=Nocardiopsis composta TaxID=157465 RepID=A0A7W8VFM9_9ACTN|nr:hypothetical protein [Nocardiopsis composta]MBB5434303.1 hypothetical protein [Nocardiopsis composta]